MKQILNRALREILGPLTGLRAVVLSVAPDGLIAWSWSRDDRHEIALGFAALDRAATVCLEGLGASQRSRSLLLTAQDAWVASWPLYEIPEGEPNSERERLVITTVFSGELQSGMVMVYGARVRLHIRAALDAAREPELARLRMQLVDHIHGSEDPAKALHDLARAAAIDLRRLDRLDQLSQAEARHLSELTQSRASATIDHLPLRGPKRDHATRRHQDPRQ
jgi:hypothetical protein